LKETVNNCVNDLFDKSLYKGTLVKNDIRILLDLATSNSSFIFGGSLFEQIDGVAMGSPLGPTLANAFLCHYEKIWLENCRIEFKPLVYRRYVDDIFVLFKSKDQLECFVKYFNSRHRSMKFTYEIENNDQFSFLDICITRKNGNFETSTYRKPTFSGVFTNFNSFIDLRYKKSLLHTLLFRSFSLSSNYEKFHQEIEYLKNIFKQNNYPTSFIDTSIRKFLKNIYTEKEVPVSVSKKEILIVLPYLGSLSSSFKRKINSCFVDLLPYCKAKIVFKSNNRLSSIFSFKNKIPKELCSNLVYKFSCGSCNVSYIGKTNRHLKVRACEHLGITPIKEQRSINIKTSAINDHLLFCNHESDFSNFSIIANEPNRWRLLLKEGILISKQKPFL
jgi:hypothetical protein